MDTRPVPAWMQKARQFAARAPSPVGGAFSAKREGQAVALYLYDQIGRDPFTGGGITAQPVAEALAGAKSGDTLDIHINSPGGEVFEGVAIANAIRSFPGRSTVYVDGVAASIASIIALAGDRVVMNEGAMLMVHDPAAGIFAMGTAEDIEDASRKMVAALRKVRESLLATYVNETGRSLSEVSGWMTAETWMTADEAKARGFADEVAKPPPEEKRPVARESYATAKALRERTLSNLRNTASRAAAPASRDHKASK